MACWHTIRLIYILNKYKLYNCLLAIITHILYNSEFVYSVETPCVKLKAYKLFQRGDTNIEVRLVYNSLLVLEYSHE